MTEKEIIELIILTDENLRGTMQYQELKDYEVKLYNSLVESNPGVDEIMILDALDQYDQEHYDYYGQLKEAINEEKDTWIRYKNSSLEVCPQTGQVRNFKSKHLYKLTGNVYGYCKVPVKIDDKRKEVFVHRIIWETVYGPIPKGYVIDHIDEDKTNNKISNLRLVTHADNRRYYIEGKSLRKTRNTIRNAIYTG